MDRRIFLYGVAAYLGLPASGAFAQAYPSRTIKIIVPTPAGGPVDTMARVIANALPAILGQPVVIENRAGAGNTLGSKAAAIADPDGYTLSYTAASGLIMSPMLYKSASYTAADFAPVAIVSETPMVLVANPAAPLRRCRSWSPTPRPIPASSTIRPAARGPCPISPPSCSSGSSARRSPTCRFINNGQLKALTRAAGRPSPIAACAPKRLAQLPDVPSMPELGYPTITTSAWTALLAPKRTPPDVVARLNQATNEALQSKPVAEALQRLGTEPRGGGPDALAAVIKADTEKWGPIVQALGLKAD